MMYLYLLLISVYSIACSNQMADDAQPDQATPSAQAVTVTPDKTSYQSNESLIVTINNQMEKSITSTDQQTFCSIILLEQKSGEHWQAVRNCTPYAPSREVTINAGSSEAITLTPNQYATGNLPAGTYRASLIYTIGDNFKPAENSKATSASFIVR